MRSAAPYHPSLYSAKERQQLRSPAHLALLRRRELLQPHLYDKEERAAIRFSHDVQNDEVLSQDSVEGPRDRNGYDRADGNNFVVSDESVVFSDDTSTDDNSCTTLSDDSEDSAESASEHERRMDIIERQHFRSKAKCKPGEFLAYSCSRGALDLMRDDEIIVKRPTSRTPLMELLLTSILRSDLRRLRPETIGEILRLLHLLPGEYAISVYYSIIKRLRPVSHSFFKFLYRCVVAYLPEHKRIFGHAYKRCVTKKEASKKSDGKRKPHLRPPSIKNIEDIEDAVTRFYSEYRAYARDHRHVDHQTVPRLARART